MDRFNLSDIIKQQLENSDTCTTIIIDNIPIDGQRTRYRVDRILDKCSYDDYVMGFICHSSFGHLIETGKEVLFNGDTYFIKYFESDEFVFNMCIGK